MNELFVSFGGENDQLFQGSFVWVVGEGSEDLQGFLAVFDHLVLGIVDAARMIDLFHQRGYPAGIAVMVLYRVDDRMLFCMGSVVEGIDQGKPAAALSTDFSTDSPQYKRWGRDRRTDRRTVGPAGKSASRD